MFRLEPIVVASAVAAQFLAALLALSLVRLTRRWVAWLSISAAITLMALRRLESLVGLLSGGPTPGLLFEVNGLVISLLMLAGMYLVRPLFADLSRSEVQQREMASRLAILSGEQGLLLEQTRDFIFRHDPSGMITYVSPAVEQVTGFPASEWLGHFTKHYTDHPANKIARQLTEEMVRSGAPGLSYRTEVLHKDGSTVWLEVSKQPYEIDGRVAGCVGVARDVTARVRLEQERERLIVDLQGALGNIKTLKGMLPICASCKKVRDDEGYWNQIEAYVSKHSEAVFSHGICPDCLRKLYPDLVPEAGER